LNARNQESKRIREEKRVLEDTVRTEKDMFMALEIEINYRGKNKKMKKD
jgi:hypothetical protein